MNKQGVIVGGDDVFKTSLVKDGSVIHGVLTQPSEQLILERNAELRKTPGVLKDMSFGRQVASIPLIIYDKWRRENPKMRSDSTKERSEELMRLLRLPENRIYCVTTESL